MRKTIKALCISLCAVLVMVVAVSAAGNVTFYQNKTTYDNSTYAVNAETVTGYKDSGKIPGTYYGIAYANNWSKAVESNDDSWSGYVINSYSYDNFDGSLILKAPAGSEEKSFKQIQTKQNLNAKIAGLVSDVKATAGAKMAIDISGTFTTKSTDGSNVGTIQYCIGGISSKDTMLAKKDSLKLVSGETTTILFDAEEFEGSPSCVWLQFNNATAEGGTEWINPTFTVSLPYLYCEAQAQPETTEAPLVTTPDGFDFNAPLTSAICSLNWTNSNSAFTAGQRANSSYFFLTNKTDQFQKQIHASVLVQNMSDVVKTAINNNGKICIDIYPTFATGSTPQCYIKMNWTGTSSNGDYDLPCKTGEKQTLSYSPSELAEGEATKGFVIVFQNYSFGSGISSDCQFCVTAPYVVDEYGVPVQTQLLYGDVDDNGALNAQDLLSMQNYLINIPNTFTAAYKTDYTHDGKVDMKDVLELKKYLASL